VASTDQGIAYLRAGLDPEEFAVGFRARFGRPVVPGRQPPSGLLAALRAEPGGLEQLRFDLSGLTGFARDVLDATRRIPAGQTRPYSWVAGEIGRPRAVRAVGSVLGRNPVPILIPCHRVTRSDGELGGYMFGTPAKERLLRAERADVEGPRRRAGRAGRGR
jgi:O-6-methylguanine DNA methyltransferase